MERKKSIWYDKISDNTLFSSIPEISFYDFFIKYRNYNAGKTAIWYEGKRITYKKLLSDIDKAACALHNMKVKKGDIVTIISPNIPQAVVLVYAVNKIGATCSMLHPGLSGEEIERIIKNTESKIVFFFDKTLEKVNIDKYNHSVKFISLRVSQYLPIVKKQIYFSKHEKKCFANSVCEWNEFIKNSDKKSVSRQSETRDVFNDIAMIMYTGGTSGQSKGVCLTDLNINSVAIQSLEAVDCFAYFRSLAVIPVFHGYGFCETIHTMLSMGNTVYLCPEYNIKKCNDLIFNKKINFIFGVPGIIEAFSRDERADSKKIKNIKLIINGGDVLNIQTENRLNKYIAKFGSECKVLSGYGMTECVAGCIGNPFFAPKNQSVGIPYPDTYAKIISPQTGEMLSPGETGELCVCSPSVMKGYYKDDEATANVLKKHSDGKIWLHTGDAFICDEDGYYFFQYRLNRMIVTNGYNVYPSQIENEILKLDIVENCCVVGKKSKICGEIPVLAVVVKKMCQLSENEIKEKIIDYSKECVADFALPQAIVLLEKLPLTKVGKTDYREVEKIIAEM